MVLLPMAAAAAALISAVPVPQSSFVLSVQTDSIRTARLHCEPTGGDHANAAEACGALSEVDGRIEDLATETAVCTFQYAPVRVTATGTWRGRERTFTSEYANSCLLRASTGPVFAF
ncbi:SSI family serine proteinase inhibitor [Saccharothrix coeruleofusca]|nr:SSI family serine proteinase inhibitor [Saccharothrix coeruleofusca]